MSGVAKLSKNQNVTRYLVRNVNDIKILRKTDKK